MERKKAPTQRVCRGRETDDKLHNVGEVYTFDATGDNSLVAVDTYGNRFQQDVTLNFRYENPAGNFSILQFNVVEQTSDSRLGSLQ